MELQFDEIGNWSEIKLHIVSEYAKAYSRILAKQPRLFHIYIDGFSGAGIHKSKEHGDLVSGSPVNALNVKPPFAEYHFIDSDDDKVQYLKRIAVSYQNVHVHHGDCNEILVENVFPTVKYEEFKRGLCLLDPYGLHLNWEVIRSAAAARTIEIFLNFPVMDINRNILWRNPDPVSPKQIARLDAFWGDQSWRDIAYHSEPTLFGDTATKNTNRVIVEAFRKRLQEEAGFEFVPEPIPMRNNQGADVYYLFFASPNRVAGKIVKQILDKYRNHI